MYFVESRIYEIIKRSILVAEFGSLHDNISKSTVFMDQVRCFLFNPPIAKDFSISVLENVLQTKVSAVGSSLGMKKNFRSDLRSWL